MNKWHTFRKLYFSRKQIFIPLQRRQLDDGRSCRSGSTSINTHEKKMERDAKTSRNQQSHFFLLNLQSRHTGTGWCVPSDLAPGHRTGWLPSAGAGEMHACMHHFGRMRKLLSTLLHSAMCTRARSRCVPLRPLVRLLAGLFAVAVRPSVRNFALSHCVARA